MAELAAGPSTSQEEIREMQTADDEIDDHSEPKPKRIKVHPEIDAKLEERLNGILRCTVCLDLPRVAMYQVGKKATSPIGPGHQVNALVKQ